MNTDLLLKVLQLDSLLGLLQWKDRVIIHLFMNGKSSSPSPKSIEIYMWIEYNNWEPPQMKYGQDYLQYFYCANSETWLPVEDYLKLYPEPQKLTFKN